MSGSEPADLDRPLSALPPEEKASRAGSFGGVASHYERYRPGPSAAAVDWILPARVRTVVDLGAGTGACTRMLTERADDVVAVEPDDRMRSVLVEQVPGVRALKGRGESMPLPDACADAVLASSSWHWMDPAPTLAEVHRVLVPGGVLGAVWSGPDPDGAFLVQAQALLAERRAAARASTDDAERDAEIEVVSFMSDARRRLPILEIPTGSGFAAPEHEVFTWDVALDADDLIGLLGTLSWVITLPEDARERLVTEARRLLAELLGVEGDVTVDVAFRADAWRARRDDA
jgi:SAM-dependent methyltransferase